VNTTIHDGELLDMISCEVYVYGLRDPLQPRRHWGVLQTVGEAFTEFREAVKIIIRGSSDFNVASFEGTRSLLETIFP